MMNNRNNQTNNETKNDHLMAQYIGIMILGEMRRQLGLEAMLEYMNQHRSIIEQTNPRLQSAVKDAMAIINVEKIYKDAFEWSEKEY